MRAALLTEPKPVADRPLEVVEQPDPELGSDEVLIAVTACAVCRTDLQLCEGDLAAQTLPIIPGHQIVGTLRAKR